MNKIIPGKKSPKDLPNYQ